MRRLMPLLLASAALLNACGAADSSGTTVPGSTVQSRVAPDQESADGREPGSPLSGARLTIYDGEEIVLERTLDDSGEADVAIAAGSYTVQVALAADEPDGCFWGATEYDVQLPNSRLVLEAYLICSG